MKMKKYLVAASALALCGAAKVLSSCGGNNAAKVEYVDAEGKTQTVEVKATEDSTEVSKAVYAYVQNQTSKNRAIPSELSLNVSEEVSVSGKTAKNSDLMNLISMLVNRPVSAEKVLAPLSLEGDATSMPALTNPFSLSEKLTANVSVKIPTVTVDVKDKSAEEAQKEMAEKGKAFLKGIEASANVNVETKLPDIAAFINAMSTEGSDVDAVSLEGKKEMKATIQAYLKDLNAVVKTSGNLESTYFQTIPYVSEYADLIGELLGTTGKELKFDFATNFAQPIDKASSFVGAALANLNGAAGEDAETSGLLPIAVSMEQITEFVTSNKVAITKVDGTNVTFKLTGAPSAANVSSLDVLDVTTTSDSTTKLSDAVFELTVNVANLNYAKLNISMGEFLTSYVKSIPAASTFIADFNAKLDATVEITDNGKEIIDRTLEANAYLFFDGLIDGEQQDRVLYYKKASKETLCKYKGMDIDIEENTMENCISVIDKLYFANNTSSKKSDKSFICKIDVLKEISELIEEQKEEMSLGELKELCLKKLSSFNIDSDVKESIVDGLFKNCNYLSLMAGSVKERNLKSTQFVITPNKILCMQTLNNIENEVSFKLVDKDEIKTMINDIMKSLEVS